MPRKRFLLKTRYIDIGAVLSRRLGVVAVIRMLAGLGGDVSFASTASEQVAKDSESGTRNTERDGQNKSQDPNQGSPTGSGMRPGWHTPQPETLPKPTYWPVVLALGIVFILLGIVTSLLISGVGIILFALALAGWIGELRRERER